MRLSERVQSGPANKQCKIVSRCQDAHHVATVNPPNNLQCKNNLRAFRTIFYTVTTELCMKFLKQNGQLPCVQYDLRSRDDS